MRRRELLFLATSGVIGVGIGGFAACSGDPAPEGGEPNGGTMVIAWGSDISTLIALVASSASDGAIADSITVPMLDAAFDCSLKKLPGYATDWSWSDDGKILKMTLRDDLTWSDGTPVTPDDIKFTYDLIADPVVASPRKDYTQRMEADARPLILDKTHIEWHFTTAYDRDSQAAHVSMNLLPKHILEKADRSSLKGNAFGTNPVVFGPWKLGTYEPKVRIVLEPNEKFTGPPEMKAKLKRVILKIIPEYNTRLLELEKGDVHMMEGVRIPDVERLKQTQPNLNFVRRGFRFMDYVGWNLDNPLFSDKRVRVALAHAASVDDLIQNLLTTSTGEKYGRPAYSTITPELCGVVPEALVPYNYDVEAAKKLLAEAGWADSNGDGVLDKDGVKFEFELLTNAESSRRNDAAIRLQAAFKAVGVQMNITKLDFNNLSERTRARDFQAILLGWSAGLFIDPSDMWHSDDVDATGKVTKKREFNYPNYRNPEVDALIEKGLSTPTPEEAAPIWKEMQAKIYADQPYLFLYWMDDVVAVDKKFDVKPNILSPLFHLYDWKLAPTQPAATP